MKIMYICGMYCPSHGGAEISMYSLLKQFKYLGWNVIVVTDSRYANSRNNKRFNKIKIKAINHKKRVEEIEKQIVSFNPDLILTQLMWSDIALKLAKKHRIPSIMRVCKIPLKLDLRIDSEYAPTKIIANSNAVKKYIKKSWNREAQIIRPLIKTKEYLIKTKQFNPFNNKYIVMFNPLIRKGGGVFREIAKKLPEKKFGAVMGWSSLKDSPTSNKFSNEYLQRITESEGEVFDGLLPCYVDFSDCPNIKIFKSEDDARQIYKKTKILLIPSQWEEAFGRVAIEAMVNGIPVIGSNIGGLKEAIGRGGILLNKQEIDKWISEILKLDNLDYYNKMSKKARKWVKTDYSETQIVKSSVKLIKEAVNLANKQRQSIKKII